MNPGRQASIERGLTGICRKVYECVALQEERALPVITAELARKGHALQKHIIVGCLRTLVDQGLVKEGGSPGAAVWWRIQPRAEREKVDPAPAAAPPPPDQLPMTSFARLATLAQVLREAANEAESVALALEEERKADRDQLDKFSQLKKLLA